MLLAIFMHTRNHRVALAHAVVDSCNKLCHLPPVLVGVLCLVEIVIFTLVCRLCWFPDRLSVCAYVLYLDKVELSVKSGLFTNYIKAVVNWILCVLAIRNSPCAIFIGMLHMYIIQ